MAKATAKCICKHCGKTFTMTKDCTSRSQADSWEDYAKDYYDECPECRKARREAEESEKYDEVEMFYGDYKKKYAGYKTKSGSYNASTKTIIVLIPKIENAPVAANTEQTEEGKMEAKLKVCGAVSFEKGFRRHYNKWFVYEDDHNCMVSIPSKKLLSGTAEEVDAWIRKNCTVTKYGLQQKGKEDTYKMISVCHE